MNRLATGNTFPFPNIGDIGRNLSLVDFFMFDGLEDFFTDVKFPKYNTVMRGDDVEIEVALAGYAKEDIDIELSSENVLTVSSTTDEDGGVVEDEEELGYTYVHHGVASRNFRINFKVGLTHEVGEITYDNGLLRIPLVSKAPEKPKTRILKIT